MNEKPWLAHYDADIPHSLKPYPEITFLDIVANAAQERPNAPICLFKGASLSFQKLEKLSNALASALVDKGVKKGDRVALLLPNTPQFFISMFAIWKAGGILVPLNPMYTAPELENAFRECGAQLAIVLTPFYEKVKAVQKSTSLQSFIATNVKEYMPAPLAILFTLLMEKQEGHRIRLQPGDDWLGSLLKLYAGAARPAVRVHPTDPAAIFFTGGTTGIPKAAVGFHQGLVMMGMQIRAWHASILEYWEDIALMNMPFFHMGGFGCLCPCLVNKSPMALIPNPRDIPDQVKTIRKVRPAILPGVPTLYNALMNNKDVLSGKVDFSSVKLSLCGTAPMTAEMKNRFEKLTGGHMVDFYSATEAMMAGVVTPIQGAYKPGAIGLPLPDVELKIVDLETGTKDLGLNETGEILIRAPQLMCGYWMRPDETAEVLRNGWLYTGDIGYLDEDGYLFLVDRKKDLIKPGGFQVWPREVEEIIASHPAVAEVGVAGIPDEYQGEAVKAWVVLRDGCQVSSEELRHYCRDKLVGYKIPKQVEFRNSLPKTQIGKVSRRELVREEREKVDREKISIKEG